MRNVIAFDRADDFAREHFIDFDPSHDPEAIWEWDGHGWIAVAGSELHGLERASA